MSLILFFLLQCLFSTYPHCRRVIFRWLYFIHWDTHEVSTGSKINALYNWDKCNGASWNTMQDFTSMPNLNPEQWHVYVCQNKQYDNILRLSTKNVPQHSNANILYILSKATMFSPFEIFLNQSMSCVSWHSVVLKFIKKDLIAAISFRQRFSEGRKNIARHKTQKVCVQNPPWVMLQTIIYMLGNMGLAAK